jgi:hypothetical protein
MDAQGRTYELGGLTDACYRAAVRTYWRDHFRGTALEEARTIIRPGTFLQLHWRPGAQLDVTATIQGRLTQPTAVYFWRFQLGTDGHYTCMGGSLDL